MPARKRASFFLSIFILLTLVLPVAAAPGEPLALLNVMDPSPAAARSIASAGGVVVQELRSCRLVCAPLPVLPRLRAQGVSFNVLGYPPEGVSFFLLHSTFASPLLPHASGIQCRPLEAGIWLLWTAHPDFRDHLARPFRLKALQLSGTIPGPRGVGVLESRAQPRSADGIADLVARVSREQLQADIRILQDFQTRFASTSQCEAAGDFILKRFQQIGLAAESDPFAFESAYQSKNIVAVIPGRVAPKRIVLACAHYDSYSNKRLVAAPGADDNASGTAAILELARILASEEFDFSVVLLCVSAEEWGLYGSAHYARQARQEGAQIVAVVNLDMIAYPDALRQELDVIGDRQSEWLADRFIAVAQPHVRLHLDKVIDPSLTWSDHSSFWDQGYSALCGIEDSDNPYYHKTSDTLEMLDLGFAVDATRAALAVVADLAQPLGALKAPTGLEARSQVSAALFTSRKTVYLQWDAGNASLAGFHVYRANAAHGTYARLTEQPIQANRFVDPLLVPDQSFYYVVSAVDKSGRESHYSAEVRDDENN